jgi:hypothetical protein
MPGYSTKRELQLPTGKGIFPAGYLIGGGWLSIAVFARFAQAIDIGRRYLLPIKKGPGCCPEPNMPITG